MSKLKRWLRDPYVRKRQIGMLVGVQLLSIAVSLFVMLDFGTDPNSSLSIGLAARLGISYGVCQMLMNLIMIIFVLLFGRGFIGTGTICNMFLLGYIADGCTWILRRLVPAYDHLTLPARIGILIPTVVIFLLGAVLYMTASAGVAPYDAIPMLLSARLPGIPFRFIRMAWDALFTVMSLWIGGPVGLMTVLVILTVGPVVSWLGRLIGRRLYGLPGVE